MAAEVGTLKLGDWLATFEWTLDLALLRGKKPEESIRSPCFTTLIPDNSTAKWQIQLYPNGINRRSKGYLSIYLDSKECNVLMCKSFLVYFSIINDQNQEFQDVPVEDAVPNSRIRGIEKFIRRDLLIGGSNFFFSLNNQEGKVTIKCCIKMSVGKHSKPIPPPRILKPNLIPYSLARSQSLDNLDNFHYQTEEENDLEDSDSLEIMDDFDSLLIHGRSDVKLLAGGKSFHAHKAVLAARSTVFASQFEQDKLDKRGQSIIDTGNLDPEVLKKVMRFVYIGKIINLDESAPEMLGPANKYALNELKDLCEDAMIKHLNIFNASDYLVLSGKHEATRLRTYVMGFFRDNAMEIKQTPGFQNMAGPNVIDITDLFALFMPATS